MPRTLLCFHAHPDDECIATAGVMARAADAGHRVVLVVATRGEHGEVQPGVLDPGETLADRRVQELHRSAEILGVARVALLGYVDSGMMGAPTNEAPGSFWTADVDEAARRLAAILEEERADVLTTYDEHGNYGHPDHIQVHRVGQRAAELARVPRVYQATMNRDHVLRNMARARAQDVEGPEPEVDVTTLGVPEAAITTAVDVRPWLDRKRASMRAHASQIAESSFFLTLPDEAFAEAFGTEWFVREGAPPRPPGAWERDLFEGLDGEEGR